MKSKLGHFKFPCRCHRGCKNSCSPWTSPHRAGTWGGSVLSVIPLMWWMLQLHGTRSGWEGRAVSCHVQVPVEVYSETVIKNIQETVCSYMSSYTTLCDNVTHLRWFCIVCRLRGSSGGGPGPSAGWGRYGSRGASTRRVSPLAEQ